MIYARSADVEGEYTLPGQGRTNLMQARSSFSQPGRVQCPETHGRYLTPASAHGIQQHPRMHGPEGQHVVPLAPQRPDLFAVIQRPFAELPHKRKCAAPRPY